jgi:hypothetical protein
MTPQPDPPRLPATDRRLAAQLRALLAAGQVWPPALVPEMARLLAEMDAPTRTEEMAA